MNWSRYEKVKSVCVTEDSGKHLITVTGVGQSGTHMAPKVSLMLWLGNRLVAHFADVTHFVMYGLVAVEIDERGNIVGWIEE